MAKSQPVALGFLGSFNWLPTDCSKTAWPVRRAWVKSYFLHQRNNTCITNAAGSQIVFMISLIDLGRRVDLGLSLLDNLGERPEANHALLLALARHLARYPVPPLLASLGELRQRRLQRHLQSYNDHFEDFHSCVIKLGSRTWWFRDSAEICVIVEWAHQGGQESSRNLRGVKL